MRRPSLVLQLLLGLLASAAIYVALTLPPRAIRLQAGSPSSTTVYGGYHLHSNRSDGTGTPDEIAAAAARAGLSFIILTDHGDATRPPDPPQYRHGVLCIDAAEVSTAAGHAVALGLDRPSPYPLAGEARDVIEDIHRLGGWVVVAHPDSPKLELRWRAANVSYEGLEWLNADSEWRDESLAHLAGTVARYLVRPPETIASLFQRPVQTLRRWDTATHTRAVVGLAALDAHARIGWRQSADPHRGRTLAAVPTYLEMFRTLTQAAVLDRPLSGDGATDSALVLGALRAGHAFSVVSAIASPVAFTFLATANGATIPMGAWVGPMGTTATFRASVNAATARVALLHNGTEIAANRGHVEFSGSVTPGAYRIEISFPGVAVPWIVSNPIYGGEPLQSRAPDDAKRPPPVRLVSLPGGSGWTIERDPTSQGTASADGRASRLTFALGPGIPSGQYAALVTSVDTALSQEGFDRVQFIVRADRPMRLSVQLRLPGGRDGQRWRQSVYADETPRTVVLDLQDFLPTGRTTSQRPIVAHVRSVLFVVDTLNTAPSSRGSLWLSDVALGVGKTGE